MSEVTKQETKVVDIKPGDIKKMLAEGKTRKEIGEHYGLNRTNTANLFKNPRLKGLKTKNVGGITFNLVDDGTAPIVSKTKVKKDGEATSEATQDGAIASAPKVEEAPVTVAEENW